MLCWEEAKELIALLGIWSNMAVVAVGGMGVGWGIGGC